MKKYHFYADPAHAWLRVPKEELVNLGIDKQISAYSYMNGNWAYLEEDCDATAFCRAKGIPPSETEKHVDSHRTNLSSSIRNYDAYKA